MMTLTIWLSLRASKHTHRNWGYCPHSVIATAMIVVLLVPAVTGLMTLATRQSKNATATLRYRYIHQVVGYTLLLLGFLECLTGIYDFFIAYEPSLAWPLVIANTVLTIVVAGFCEMIYQAKLKKEKEIKRPDATLTLKEFEKLVSRGHKLVILDDLVLDVKDYTQLHPGGNLVFDENIGRDVSKFFYGGYSMNGQKCYAHSYFARKIV
jgi:hypothetical protein